MHRSFFFIWNISSDLIFLWEMCTHTILHTTMHLCGSFILVPKFGKYLLISNEIYVWLSNGTSTQKVDSCSPRGHTLNNAVLVKSILHINCNNLSKICYLETKGDLWARFETKVNIKQTLVIWPSNKSHLLHKVTYRCC